MDALDYTVAAILSITLSNGDIHPIAFYSRTLTTWTRTFPPPNPRSQQDLAIIPPVLCHIGFVLGGIRSAATTNPKGLLLHTWIRTQTHQRHLQCQTLCRSTGYPLSATAIMVIMRHYSHEQSIWMLFKSILLIWKDIHWRYLGGFEYVIGLPYTFNLIYF